MNDDEVVLHDFNPDDYTDDELRAMGIEPFVMEDCGVVDSDLSLGLWLEELDRLSGGGPFNPMDGSEPRFRINSKE